MSYAIFKTGGKQYRVAQGDVLEIEKLPVDAGATIEFTDVLLSGSGDSVKVGAPFVSGATVKAEVLEHFRGEKVRTFKFKRRQGYHKTIGHRQSLTKVRIVAI
jgi:large subunit ribosomal protein L21